jgi:hypothetical protein
MAASKEFVEAAAKYVKAYQTASPAGQDEILVEIADGDLAVIEALIESSSLGK